VTARGVERALWAATILALLVGARGWWAASAPRPVARPPVRGPAPRTPVATSPAEVARAARTIVDGNLFRRDRRPADSVVVAQQQVSQTARPPAPPKPQLVLRGIIGGPPWDAILDGVPGRSGSIVARRGDRFGPLTIHAVRRDTILIQGMDTTWTLTLRRP
jgi:hypothetical protein